MSVYLAFAWCKKDATLEEKSSAAKTHQVAISQSFPKYGVNEAPKVNKVQDD